MPKHTRGKIREHLEGIHRNTEAIKIHCVKSLALIDDKSPDYEKAFTALIALTNNLDEFTQEVYSRL